MPCNRAKKTIIYKLLGAIVSMRACKHCFLKTSMSNKDPSSIIAVIDALG